MEFTSGQQHALELLDSGANVFLTGHAGTGKSTVVNHWLNLNPDVPRLAPTGMAAVNIGGRTLHSFFGIGAPKNEKQAIANFFKKERFVKDRLKDVNSVVIDEISMVGGQTFSALEHICRYAKGSPKPWGGLQLIVVGDFYQLRPVEDSWPFLTEAWDKAGFRTVSLTEIMRTDDAEFIDVLNEVRAGEISDFGEDYLNSKIVKDHYELEGVRLFAHNATVDRYNAAELAKLSGRTFEFRTKTATYSPSCETYSGGYITKCHAKSQARYRDVESIPANLYCEDPCQGCPSKYDPKSFEYSYLNSLPIPGTLVLKIGAQVMVRKNHPEGAYINGTVGKVVDVRDESIKIATENGSVCVEKTMFEVRNGDGKVIFTGTNYPLILAWATTIHKAQGRSIDRIITDLRGLFDCGQAYVSLSRARSGAGVHLLGWDLQSIKVDKRVREFYEQVGV
jgi:ATP-dependent DNA helicase PIF1